MRRRHRWPISRPRPAPGIALVTSVLLLGLLSVLVLAQVRGALTERKITSAYSAHQSILNLAEGRVRAGEVVLRNNPAAASFAAGDNYRIRRISEQALVSASLISETRHFYTVRGFATETAAPAARACVQTVYEATETCLFALGLLGIRISLGCSFSAPNRIHWSEVPGVNQSQCLS